MNRSLRIAVADGDPEMRSFYSRVLRSLGHETLVVGETGSELIDGCRRQLPDLIILESDLPDGDGLQTAETICRGQRIPTIFVSAEPDPSLIDRSQHAHVGAYLAKPITQADLEPAIALVVLRFQRLLTLADEVARLRTAGSH